MRLSNTIISGSCLTMLPALLALANPIGLAGEEAVFEHLLVKVAERTQERIDTIDTYVKRVANTPTLMGRTGIEEDENTFITSAGPCTVAANCVVYKVEKIGEDDEGNNLWSVRQLSNLEVAELAGVSLGSELMRDMGSGMLLAQGISNSAITGSADPDGKMMTVARYFVAEGEKKEQLQKEIGAEQPWADPFAMVGVGGLVILDTAKAVEEAEQSLRSGAAKARREAERKANLLEQLVPYAVEEFGTVRAARYYAPSLNMPAGEVEGQQITWRSANLWIDPDRLVILGHRLDGTIEADGQAREFYLQVMNGDFRNPPGCGEMLEPFTQTIEMGGMLDDEQMAQMEEAKRQLEEFDRQMASMSPQERQMVESMMGGQMDAVRNMAESGAISYTMEIEEILCNPDLKALFAVPSMEGGDVSPSSDNLLVQIQRDLVTLGYEPGNTDGILDTMTQVAISQFQAEAGLEVTGEPSQALADALRNAVANQ